MTDPSQQHVMQNMLAAFFFVAYLALVIVAICGSFTVILLVLRYRNLRSRPINFYYVNMAFGDLFLASLGAPFRALYYLDLRWKFGVFLCHWFEYAENLGYFVHVYSLAVAACLVLQDVASVRRCSYRRTDVTAKSTTCLRSYAVTSFGIWTFGILACLPYSAFRRYEQDQCLPLEPHGLFVLPERLFGPLVLIVVPVSATIVSILLIICCACSTTRRVVSTYQDNVLLRSQKSTRYLSLLMLIHILCQVPHFALKWLRLGALAHHDTVQLCAAGLRLASACFSATFFFYISEDKVLFNVRHATAGGSIQRSLKRNGVGGSGAHSCNNGTGDSRCKAGQLAESDETLLPLRSVSEIQCQRSPASETPAAAAGGFRGGGLGDVNHNDVDDDGDNGIDNTDNTGRSHPAINPTPRPTVNSYNSHNGASGGGSFGSIRHNKSRDKPGVTFAAAAGAPDHGVHGPPGTHSIAINPTNVQPIRRAQPETYV